MNDRKCCGGICRAGHLKTSEESVELPKWAMNSKQIFNGSREVLISHGSDEYRLMITRSNKLLLVK